MSTNGKLPQSELAQVFDAGGLKLYLAKDAAAAWNSLCLLAARRQDWGTPGFDGPDSAYRTYDRQVYWRNYWCGQGNCGNAAVPGTSNHGLGKAGDVNEATRHIFQTGGGQAFGWRKIEAFSEPWHWNYVGGFSRPDPGPDRAFPVLKLGSGGPGQDFHVRQIQKQLGLKADGEFGKTTKTAVQDFQDRKNLGSTGIVDKRTWLALKKENA